MEHAAQDVAQEILKMMAPMVADIQARIASGVPLDPEPLRAMREAFVAELRSRGWLRDVGSEQLADILDVLVIRDDAGNAELHVESNVTGSVIGVPGWGVTETDPALIGRGLAEDEADLLDDARDEGELTGWE